jgi:hypothetical protein
VMPPFFLLRRRVLTIEPQPLKGLWRYPTDKTPPKVHSKRTN